MSDPFADIPLAKVSAGSKSANQDPFSDLPSIKAEKNPIPGANGDEDKYKLDSKTVSLGPSNTPRSDLPTGYATPWENIKDIGSNIASGAVQFGSMAAKSIKTIAPLIANYSDESAALNPENSLSKEEIDKNTQYIKNAAQKMADHLSGVAKDISAPERNRSVAADVLVHGATNVGMAVPAIAASVLGAPEALVAGGMGLIFGGSSYEDKSQAVLDNGGSKEDAHHAGLLSGAINGFGGAAVSYLTLGLGSLVKNTIGKEAAPTMDGVINTLTNQEILKPFAKGFATRLAADPLIFNAQSLADREVDKSYDLPYEHDISKVIKQATGDGVAMAVLSSPLGAYGAYKSAKYRGAFGDALNNPDAPESMRAQAAMTTAAVAKNAGVPIDQVNGWLANSAEAIRSKKPLSDFDQNVAHDIPEVDDKSPIIRQMDQIRPVVGSNPSDTAEHVNSASTVDDAIKTAQNEVNAPFTHDDAKAIVDPINSKLSSGKINLVKTANDLPDGVIQNKSSDGHLIEGVYSGNGNVHIVSDNIESKDRLHQVIAHELIGHLAPEEIVKPHIYQSAIQSVMAMEKAKNPAIVELGQIVDKNQPNLDPVTRAKEIMAMSVETGRYRNSPVLRRVIGNITYSVKKFLLSKGANAGWVRKLSDQEVHAMLREGERKLFSGREQSTPLGQKASAEDKSTSSKVNNLDTSNSSNSDDSNIKSPKEIKNSEISYKDTDWEDGIDGTKKKRYIAAHGENGKDIGNALIYKNPNGSFDLSDIKVRPEFERNGIATKLLDRAFLDTGANEINIFGGTTGAGSKLLQAYGEGVNHEGKRTILRPERLKTAGDISSDVDGDHIKDVAKPNAEEQVEQAKKSLDDVGITGSDRTSAIAAVRRGDLTAQEVVESHKPSEKIEDFGEKIGGAKKDLWQTYQKAMSEELPIDAKDITLSKHFPEPNYEALIDKGVDVKTLAAVKAMRDEIPSKPQKAYKLKIWAEQVRALREFSNDLLSGKHDVEHILNLMRNNSVLRKFADRIEMYSDIGYPAFKNARDYQITSGWQTPGKEGTQFAIEGKRTRNIYFGSREEAVAALKSHLNDVPESSKKSISFDIYRITKTGEIVVGKKVASGKYIDLKTGFKDAKEARQYVRENQEALEKSLEARKENPVIRRGVNEPRVGTDYRNGDNITPNEFKDEFGFRGIQFGNYVEQGRRQLELNNSYDALRDLANVIGIPSKAISLNGQLALAFGARGHGGPDPAAAHYEPGHAVINLTKTNGFGSLGHEWFHALDNYFGKASEKLTYLTHSGKYSDINAQSVRPEVVEAFREVMDAIKTSDYYKRSRKIDNSRSKDYWSTNEELGARAFEAYIVAKGKEKGESNDYLSNIVGEEGYEALNSMQRDFGGDKKPYPYPTKLEQESINPAFDKLFDILQTKETDKGIALFSRKQSTKDAYEKRIDELHEDNPKTNAFEGVKVLDRSDLLDMLGYGNMPVNLAESKVVDGRYKHGLTASDWKKVPDWIDHPIAVFDSETSPGRLVFIAPETVKGSPVRLILDPSSNHQGFDAHILINAYDAKGMTPSMRWFRDGLLRFIDNKKSQSFAETSGLRLPNKSQQISSSGKKILTENNLVKYLKENPENGASEGGGNNLFSKKPENDPMSGKAHEMLDSAKSFIKSLTDEIVEGVAPMSVGSDRARAVAKDFANSERASRWQWSMFDQLLKNKFSKDQLENMWNAADEENVLRQEGKKSEVEGINRLSPEEREVVERLHVYGEELLQRAKDVGMFEGEGLPYWTPRMAVMIGEDGEYSMPPQKSDGGGSSDARNVVTSSQNLKQRKYLTAKETEDAMKAKLGEGATLVRNIRAMPMAMARLERAIAGRELVNSIKDLGKKTGIEMVSDSEKQGFFTIDSPAFKTFRPRFEEKDGKYVPVKDANGKIIFDRTPIYISNEFRGPLKAILSTKNSNLYNALMTLKAKTMGLIMYSPLIHNAVEWGRALPIMPMKVLTFKVYFEGNRVKNDPEQMRQAIKDGLVPIGHRGGMQDLTGIMEDPTLEPGRSWTAKAMGKIADQVSKNAGLAVREGVDKAGDFWHNTLLWDRVGDLQAGIYSNMKHDLIAKGMDERSAGVISAHFANRFAGALPNEAMSANARKIANFALFSRTFTIGNLGVLKDAITGLPKDVQAQLSRDVGELAMRAGKSYARKEAIAAMIFDMGFMLVGNSLLQDAMNAINGDNLSEIEQGYVRRFIKYAHSISENPLNLVSNISDISSTSDNEPGKEGRIRYGTDADGTALYFRMPIGKIGEEFTGWLTSPLKTLKNKEGTIARPISQIFFSNDKGFGNPIYDEYAKTLSTDTILNIGRIAWTIAGSQLPIDSLIAAYDVARGKGNATDAAKVFGPLIGVTTSKGAPGGPAMGDIYDADKRYKTRVSFVMPDVRRALKDEDIDKAIDLLAGTGMTSEEVSSRLNSMMSPESRLSQSAIKQFEQHSTDEQKDHFINSLSH